MNFRPSDAELLEGLKRYFGFNSFRPLQQEIVRDVLNGKDVVALLPTGGGKSLCFQFPAVLRPGLTLVISPLIALMKDQVDALSASGIPATFLNSSLKPEQARERMQGLRANKYRLLYAAPERAMLSGFQADLQRWKLELIAIDEAHCISEWGHDFRPEYRQLVQFRALFPETPILAVTATATGRVRQDIVTQLSLRAPSQYVASFNRPNLSYRVLAKSKPSDQLVDFVLDRRREAGIVYCQSRKTTEMLAERLKRERIKALPYHAGLEQATRARNQELFLRDEVQVICATIAFGMGINKSNVRYVVHYDLPRNIEGYYQETGRAGRDGLPSECLLLFSAGDVVKLNRFIDEVSEPKIQQIARGQLRRMISYAESPLCRRRELLSYFGEEYGGESCDACDNCLNPRETYDGTLDAQRFLSCVYRVKQKSGFAFGINQMADILCGAQTESVLRWNHDKISTFGIGKEHTVNDWKAIGRELVRLGHLEQITEKMGALELTPLGMRVLKERLPVELTQRAARLAKQRASRGAVACDETLFEYLRRTRKRLADEQNLPAYMIFSDATLQQMARQYPTSEAEMASISGVGTRKLAAFGSMFLTEIRSYLRTNPKQIFSESAFQPMNRR